MRILFLTQVLPYPLDAGPKIRACYMYRRLVWVLSEIQAVKNADRNPSLCPL